MRTTHSILVCSACPPTFDRDSGSQRLSDLLELLCADGWQVSFLAANGLGEPRYARALQQRGVATFDGSKVSIENLLATGTYELALFSTWSIAEIYLSRLRRESPNTRVLIDSVDLNFLRNARRLFGSLNPGKDLGRLDDRYGAELVRELNAYAAADAVLTVSQKEADLLTDLIGGSIHVVQDIEPKVTSIVRLPARRGILFLGSFRHQPNIGALEFLCREIVPQLNPALLDRHPLYLVGEELNGKLRDLALETPGVQMIGWVPSVRPYLEKARISVVPVQYGAGTKRKLLQSLMAGTPAVATRIGAEGFNLIDGKHLLIADKPALFAESMRQLLEDDLLWKRLSRDGRNYLSRIHGREAALRNLRRVLQQVLARAPIAPAATDATTSRKPQRMDFQEYQSMRQEIQKVVRNSLPADAKIIVVSRGDDEMLKLNGCSTWHFPQNSQGGYAGHHPADSASAIAQLETLRQKGAEFLLLPGTAFWWLDHYREFRAHLETNCKEIIRQDRVCLVYRFTTQQPPQLSIQLNGTANTGTNGHAVVAAPVPTQSEGYLNLLATARSESNGDYVPLTTAPTQPDPAVKLIAFYLPQFHPIPENDTWWGKGFTEWTNVSKAVPQFEGHYQPHLPGELGFYDLRVPDIQQRQVELARTYGVSGFCFYYYWFVGKRLLEKPLNQFISNPAIDFPFCVCWANENWTRRWDGKEEDVLIAQNYGKESDEQFIRDLEPILQHKNYIRIHGRPVVLVYRARLLPDPAATARRWRDYCRNHGLPDPYLIVTQVFERIDPREIGFDAAVEFPPNTPGLRSELTRKVQLFNAGYTGTVYRYSDLLELTMGTPAPPYKLFRTVCPSWDNEARRPGRGSTYAGSSPAEYRRWLDLACRATLAESDPQSRLAFVNAWNEWGEGAHLEPDRRYGYAYLQATSDVLRSLPKPSSAPAHNSTMLFVSHDANRAGAQLVLLKVLRWLKNHTAIKLKVICLDGGEWLPRFQELADTALWTQLAARSAPGHGMAEQLLDFCGGKPGLIYGNSVASGRVYAVLKQLGVPILTHFHELEMSIKRYAKDWIGDVVNCSSHFVACSGAVRDNLMVNHGIAAERISTVHAAIDVDAGCSPKTDPERAQLRERLRLALHKHVVVGCGLGMPHRKGTDLFIEVANKLWDQGRTDIHFYWVGELEPGSGPEAERLAALRRSTQEFVTFLGTQDDSKPVFQAADLFLLTSREDPFPLAALEAAGCGLPIICFQNAGGMPDFVETDAGAVVPFQDVHGMAREVVALLDNPDRRRKLGLRGREKLLAHYTVDRTCPHILSVCQRVSGQNPAVSVIVPNYNHAAYLPKRLESIFNQTFKDFEVILLDDRSSDNSLEIFKQFAREPNVRIVPNETNSGSTFKQWLKGIELARADTLWIAESDDVCEPDFLATLLAALRDPKVKLAYSNSHVIDEHGAIHGDYTGCEYLTNLSRTKWSTDYRVGANREINDGLGVKNTILSASSVVFKRFDLGPQTRRTLESLRLAGDWYFFIHAIAGGEVAYTARKLNHHRRHSESVIGKLLRQNRVGDFFGEFHTVQSAILDQYTIEAGFAQKWQEYLQEQWKAFFPGRPLEEIETYYPMSRVAARLSPAPAGVKSIAALMQTA